MGLFPCCFQKLSFSGKKTLWEKEKMLVTKIFYFSCVVFKNFLSQGIYRLELCGKWLTLQHSKNIDLSKVKTVVDDNLDEV